MIVESTGYHRIDPKNDNRIRTDVRDSEFRISS